MYILYHGWDYEGFDVDGYCESEEFAKEWVKGKEEEKEKDEFCCVGYYGYELVEKLD